MTLLSVYILGLSLSRNILITSIIAILITISPYYLSHTIWSMNEREATISFVFLIILSVITLYRDPNHNYFKYIILCILFTIIGTSFHIIFFTILPLLIFAIILIYFKKSNVNIPIVKGRLLYVLLFLFFLVLPLIIGGYFQIVSINWLYSYQTGTIISSENPLYVFINIPISFSGSIGIFLVIFGSIGFIILVLHRNRREEHAFLIGIGLLILPFIAYREYIKVIILIYCSIFAIYFLLHINHNIKRNRSAILFSILIITLIITVPQTTYTVNKWNDQIKWDNEIYINEDTINIANYNRYLNGEPYISNNQDEAMKISAYSSVPIPLTNTISKDKQFLYHLMYPNQPIPDSEYSIQFNWDVRNPENLFEYTSTDVNRYNDIMIENQTKYIPLYGIKWILVDKSYATSFSGDYLTDVLPSELLQNINKQSYKIYESTEWVIYPILAESENS